MAKMSTPRNDDTIYAEVGDKLNYAACVKNRDDNLKFIGWIRKYCVKDNGVIKSTMKEIGLS